MLKQLFQSKWTALVWTIFIFILLVLPPSSIPQKGFFSVPHLDKAVHFLLFAVLVWLWAYALTKGTGPAQQTGRVVAFTTLAAILYGTGMEFFQEHFTGRDFDLFDILADTAGAVIGALPFFLGKK